MAGLDVHSSRRRSQHVWSTGGGDPLAAGDPNPAMAALVERPLVGEYRAACRDFEHELGEHLFQYLTERD